jgi:hypothetical protein
MNSKTIITLSTMAIAAVALVFASGPIVGNQQAFAYYYGSSDLNGNGVGKTCINEPSHPQPNCSSNGLGNGANGNDAHG